jgi:hypothetical protein
MQQKREMRIWVEELASHIYIYLFIYLFFGGTVECCGRKKCKVYVMFVEFISGTNKQKTRIDGAKHVNEKIYIEINGVNLL